MINTSIEQDASHFGISIQSIDFYYPKITETLVPLSSTGITPNNYFHWKKEGLVDSPENIENENRTWVRLNIFQFVWVKIIESMRSFGLPLYAIKNAKEFLFLDIVEDLKKDKKNEMEEFLKTHSNYSSEKIGALKRLTQELENIESMPEEDKILTTSIGGIISAILLGNDQASLIVFKSINGFDATILFFKSINDFSALASEILGQPHMQIPIRPLIEEFFNEPKNENVAVVYGFINPKEKKILDAIRKNDFKELIIRFDDNERKQMIIEEIVDGDIREQKVKEIRRILGMNQYSEVTLKYRNDKQIYFKNKIRL